jgi:hypothetical protein
MREGSRLVEERGRRREATLAALKVAIRGGVDSGPTAPQSRADVRLSVGTHIVVFAPAARGHRSRARVEHVRGEDIT